MSEAMPGRLTDDERSNLLKYYALYFLGFLLVFPGVIALYLILKRRKEEQLSEPVLNHYNYMIRTFWVTATLMIGGFVLWGMPYFGWLFMLVCYAGAIWGVLRVVRGLILAFDGKGIGNPDSFGLPQPM